MKIKFKEKKNKKKPKSNLELRRKVEIPYEVGGKRESPRC